MPSQEFIQKMQSRLEEEKKKVEDKIAELTKPEEPPDNPSAEDLAEDATQDILEESLLSVYRDVLERIEDALARIKDGTYGKCIACGTEVPEQDLEKEPWGEHCRDCKPQS
jgi:DnaK suppressor protein